MKKTKMILAAMVAAFMMVSCQMPSGNIENNDNGADKTPPETEIPSDDIPDTPESSDDENGDENESDTEPILDLSVTRQFSMNVGDSILLPGNLAGVSVYYEVRTGDDVISISGTTLRAESVGDAELLARDWDDDTHYWACSVTVKAVGFNGSAIEYKLCGSWEREGGSELILNSNKTGTMKNYLNGTLLQDWTFNWSCTEGGNYKFLNITDCYDSQTGETVGDKQFTITSIRETTLVLNGNLGFGMPKSTTWTKE